MACTGCLDQLGLVVFGALHQDACLPQGPLILVGGWQSQGALCTLGAGNQGPGKAEGKSEEKPAGKRETPRREGEKERRVGEGWERRNGGKNRAGGRQRNRKPE